MLFIMLDKMAVTFVLIFFTEAENATITVRVCSTPFLCTVCLFFFTTFSLKGMLTVNAAPKENHL